VNIGTAVWLTIRKPAIKRTVAQVSIKTPLLIKPAETLTLTTTDSQNNLNITTMLH